MAADETARREHAAVEDAALLRGAPAAGRDRFTGEVDDGRGAVDVTRPRAGLPVRGPRDGAAARRRPPGAAAGEGHDVVAGADEGAGERAAEEAGAAGDDGSHGMLLTNWLVSWPGPLASPRTGSSPPPRSNSPRADTPAPASTASPAAPASTRPCSTTTSTASRACTATLLRETFTRAAERLQAIAASGAPPPDQLDSVIAAIAAFVRQHPFFAAIMLREIAESGAHLDADTVSALAALPRIVGGIIQRGVDEGAFRPVHPLAAYFSMLAPMVVYLAGAPIRRQMSARHLVSGPPLTADVFVRHIQDTMRRALGRHGDGAARPAR